MSEVIAPARVEPEHFPDWAAAAAWVAGLEGRGIKLGLENMETVLATLDDPQREVPAIHIAATNGKGSVAALVAAGLVGCGRRVGLFTSPHLIEMRERIRAWPPLDEPQLTAAAQAVRDAAERTGTAITYFEATALIAFTVFAWHECEIAVLEVGLGGRLDATNVCIPLACGIGRIGFDHTLTLGETLLAITAEKAGIMKPGIPILAIPQGPEVDAELSRQAQERGMEVSWVEVPEGSSVSPITGPAPEVLRARYATRWGEVTIPLLGVHQGENLGLALALLETASIEPGDSRIITALAGTIWPGRFQLLQRDPPVWLDGAHNPGGMQAVLAAWDAWTGERPAHLIIGMLRGKEVKRTLAVLPDRLASLIFVPIADERGLPPGELFRELPDRLHAKVETMSLDVAWDKVRARAGDDGGTVLITGSLYLAGEVLAQLGLDPFTKKPSPTRLSRLPVLLSSR